jgi:hypothetical protein
MKSHTKNVKLTLLFLLMLVCFVLISIGCELQVLDLPPNTYDYIITNPYADIEWTTIEYYDANFHTHTQLSDGQMLPHEVIDAYRSLGYSVLALTDHNTSHFNSWPATLYPWTNLSTIQNGLKSLSEGDTAYIVDKTSRTVWQNRDPIALGMISVQGSEISQNHHIGSWFNDFVGIGETEEETLNEISDRNGLAILNHPGRYERTDAWYVDMFLRFPVLIGLEIFNQQDRYKDDRSRWDRILHLTMPESPVWGFGNDDMHVSIGLGWNRNVLLLPHLSEPAIRNALVDGEFFVFKPNIRGNPPDVRITNILVKNDSIQLEIVGTCNTIQWITYYSDTQSSEILCIGETFSTTDLPVDATFVRAVVFSDGGRLFTQPFGMKRTD